MTLLNSLHHHNSINAQSQHHHHRDQTIQSPPATPTTLIPRPTTATSPVRSSTNPNTGVLDIHIKSEPLPATLNNYSARGSTPSLRSLALDEPPHFTNSVSTSASGSENHSSKASIFTATANNNNNPTVLPKPTLLSTRAQSHSNFLRKNGSQHTLPDLVHKVTDLFTGGSHSNRSQTDLAMSPKQPSNKSSTPITSRNGSSLSLNRIMESLHSSHAMSRQNNNSQSSTATANTTSTSNIPLGLQPQASQSGFRLRTHSSNHKSAQMGKSSSISSAVKETHYVHVDYDPVTRKRVLNTYEILKDLGAGQHGKVKLGKDMESHELVAIKIVDRKSKPKLGRLTRPGSTQEDKIRREIAIMKKCDHPNVVKLLEVLDAENSRKIYLVLEYLEKGEIKWQKKDKETLDQPEPILTYDQCKFVFRDVVSGLEYLHNQGIIHRDIKPSNLLVSEDNVVKISDFGVSFAANLDGNDEFELAKTAGTPAFLAPELCRTEIKGPGIRVTHKIDIWALGVTLYCLLFGTLPFHADSEFALFESINNDGFNYPNCENWKVAASLTELQLNIAKGLIDQLLRKNPEDRIDINEIKNHPFFAEGLSRTESKKYTTNWDKGMKIDISKKDVDEAVVGIGNRIKKKLSDVFNFSSSSSNNGSNSQRKHSSNGSSRRQSRIMEQQHNYGSSSSAVTPTSNSDFDLTDRSNVSFILSEANGSLARVQPSSPQVNSSTAFTSSGKFDPRLLRRPSLAPSIESSDATISSTASINDETVPANPLIQRHNSRRGSAQFQLSEILTKDTTNLISNINKSPRTFASSPLVLTDTETGGTDIGTCPGGAFPSNNESVATLNTLHDPSVDNSIHHRDVSPVDETEIADERPSSPYDYRKDLNEFTTSNMKVAPSFASLDSFYDNDYANGNLRYNPYTGFISSNVPNQRQGSKGSSGYSGSNGYPNSAHSIGSSTPGAPVSIKSPVLNPAVNRYPSLSSSSESRHRLLPLTALTSIHKDNKTHNNNSGGSYSSRENSNPLPYNTSLNSAVSIPDFLKGTDFGDPLTPSVSNKNYNNTYSSNANSGNYYATGSINPISTGVGKSQPPIRQPAALSNQYKSPLTSPPLQPRTTTPPIFNKHSEKQQQQRGRRGIAVFANDSSDDEDQDDGPITFNKSVFAKTASRSGRVTSSGLESQANESSSVFPASQAVPKHSIYGRKIRMSSDSSGQILLLEKEGDTAGYMNEAYHDYSGSDSDSDYGYDSNSDGLELLLSFNRGSKSGHGGPASTPPGRGTTLSTTTSTLGNSNPSKISGISMNHTGSSCQGKSDQLEPSSVTLTGINYTDASNNLNYNSIANNYSTENSSKRNSNIQTSSTSFTSSLDYSSTPFTTRTTTKNDFIDLKSDDETAKLKDFNCITDSGGLMLHTIPSIPSNSDNSKQGTKTINDNDDRTYSQASTKLADNDSIRSDLEVNDEVEEINPFDVEEINQTTIVDVPLSLIPSNITSVIAEENSEPSPVENMDDDQLVIDKLLVPEMRQMTITDLGALDDSTKSNAASL